MQDKDNPLHLDRSKKIAWEEARQLLRYIASEWDTCDQNEGETHEMLTRRARLLAKPPETVAAPTDIFRALCFTLGDERYAVPADAVRAVTTLSQITPVPCTPAFYLGVVNVRGKVISAIDLRSLFGMRVDDTQIDGEEQRLQIVVEAAGLEISLVADEVLGVIDLPRMGLNLPSESLVGVNPDYIAGTTVEGIILLDLEALLSDERLIVNEEVV